jgi:hypothetical protein
MTSMRDRRKLCRDFRQRYSESRCFAFRRHICLRFILIEMRDNCKEGLYALFGREMHELNDTVLDLNYWTAQLENISKDLTTLHETLLPWCNSKGLQ